MSAELTSGTGLGGTFDAPRPSLFLQPRQPDSPGSARQSASTNTLCVDPPPFSGSSRRGPHGLRLEGSGVTRHRDSDRKR